MAKTKENKAKRDKNFYKDLEAKVIQSLINNNIP